MLRQVLDLLLPPACVACDAPVAAPGLCGGCFGSLNFIASPLCMQCGLPFATQAEAGRACRACTAAPPPWGQARGAVMYDDAARALVLPLKYADRTEIAATLALHMQRAGSELLASAELLVPVPLHRSRLLHRRYNQAALLAASLSRRTGVRSLPDALQRSRATESLGALSAARRAEMLLGTISVRAYRRDAVAGRRVVLVDDVLTSGATARICTTALLDAGAANVNVLVASRVADPRREAANADGDAELDHN